MPNPGNISVTNDPGANMAPFANQRVPESVRAKLIQAMLLQRTAADTQTPVYSAKLGIAKLGAGLVGGLMQRYETEKEEAAQQANAGDRNAFLQALQQRRQQMASLPQPAGGTDPAATSTPASGAAGQPSPAGSPTSYLGRVALNESGGNPNVPNPAGSSASGLYQFTEPTWRSLQLQHPDLGLTADGRSDPTQQQRAMVALTNENASSLGRNGFDVTPGNLYLSHFAGPGGAAAALKAAPNTPVEQVLGVSAVAANPFLKGKTAGDLVGWANSKMAGVDPATIPGAPAQQPAQPAPGSAASAATNPDAPAPNAAPTGSDTLPLGVTPGMVSAGAEPSLRDTIEAAAAAQFRHPNMPAGGILVPSGKGPVPSTVVWTADGKSTPAEKAQRAADQDPNADPSLRDTITAAMGQDPAAGPLPTGAPNSSGLTGGLLQPSTMTSNPPSPDAGGLGAAPAVGTLPGADAPLPGDIPTAANMAPPNAIPNAPPDADPQMLPTTDVQALPQTGPMPPPGGQTQALLQALQARQQAASATAAPQPGPRGAAPMPPPADGSSLPPDVSALANAPTMANAPGQQAINGAMGAGPSPQRAAIAQAMLQQGAGLATPTGNSPASDPSSAQNFAQAGMGRSSLADALMQAKMQAASGAPQQQPGSLARILFQQNNPDAPALPPQGTAPAPQQPSSGQTAPAQPAQAGGTDLNALYARLAADPRTPPEYLAQVANMMTPSFRYEKTEDGNLVRVDERGMTPPQVAYRGGSKPDWHFDPATGLSSNSANGTVIRGAPPAPFTSSMKLNGIDIPVQVTPDPNGGQPKVVPLLPANQTPPGQGQPQPGPGGPITFGGQPQGSPAPAPAPAASSPASPQGAPSPFGPQVQSYIDASNKQAQAQEAAKANAKADADQIADSRSKLESLRQGGTDINQAGQALASFKGQMPTGPLGETALQLRGLANTFGLGDPAQLANMEIFAKNATKAATAQIKEVTNRATNLDMQVELKNNPGINVSDQTNRILIDHLQRANALAQTYEQSKQQYYDQNGSLQGFQPQWQASLSGASATPLSKFPLATKTIGNQSYVKLLSTDPSGYSWHPAGEVQ